LLAVFLLPAGQGGTMTTVKVIKSDTGEMVLDVLGVPFGGPFDGKDKDGEFFNSQTELWLDQIGKRPIVHYHGYSADGKSEVEPEIIGQEQGYEVKEDGVWFRVLLDKASETAQRLWKAAQDGFLRASSGAINHLVRTNHDTGHINTWPMAELSLMDINAGNYPANPYAVAVPAARSLYKSAKLNWPDQFNEQPDDAQPPPENVSVSHPVQANIQTVGEQPTMDEKVEATKAANVVTMADVAAFVEEREKEQAEQERIRQLEAEAEELKALKAQIAKAAEEKKANGQVKRLENPKPDTQPQPAVQVYSKWDGFTVGQLGLAYEMLKAVKAPMGPELYRALHVKALKLADSGELYKNQIARDDRGQITREFSPAVNAATVKAIKAINPMQQSGDAIKADELHGSDVTNAGDEWVPALWTPELWDLVRNEARVLPLFRQVEVPGESLTIPVLDSGTTVYKVAQTDDQAELDLPNAAATMTKANTGQVTLTPVKGVAWLGFTEELIEDSIVPILTTMQQVLAADLAEQIDEILISGDTDTATTNISDTGNGSISTSWHLLMVNGLRDYAFANSNTSDRGALTAEDFTAVMALLGTNGAFALDPDRLVWIVDPGVYRKLLTLGELITMDKAGGFATMFNGRVTLVFGSQVIVSDKYGATDANGKIHNTAGNNTLGSFILARPDRWRVGFGRRVRMEVPARDVTQIVTDTRHLIASFRVDFKNNGEGSAAGFNVTV
jgi:HK97 family phage major capsid protein